MPLRKKVLSHETLVDVSNLDLSGGSP